MPEILTESFCERCGTRYTFESAAPRKTRRLGQIKTLSKGMKNWVMSDDTSLDEAMAAARNDDDRELTSHQLDAFHATFNFCMTCRQYTCGNCWNTAEGRCLTCAPHLGHEILPGAFPEPAAVEPIRLEAEAWPEVDLSVAGAANGNGHDHPLQPDAVDPWAGVSAGDGEEILDFDPAARLAFLSGEAVSPVLGPEVAEPDEPVIAAAAADEPNDAAAAIVDPWPVDDDLVVAAPTEDVVAATAAGAPEAAAEAPEATVEEVEPEIAAIATADERPSDDIAAATPRALARPDLEPLPPTVEGKADVGAARTADLLRRFRPGQNIDAELAAYEAEQAQAELEPAVEATDAAEEPVLAAQADAPGETPAPKPAQRPTLTWPTAAVPEEPDASPVAAEAPTPVAAPGSVEEPVVETPASAPIAAAPVDQPEPAPIAATAPAPELLEESDAGAPAQTPVAAEAPSPEGPAPEAPAPATPARVAAEPPREDRILQPTWQIYAPDSTPAIDLPLGTPAPTAPPVQPPAASAVPQWPTRPDQVESPAMALLANRAARSTSDGLWAASAQEVLAQPASASAPAGVQPCSSCGLSLSATARFCRRCGTRQG